MAKKRIYCNKRDGGPVNNGPVSIQYRCKYTSFHGRYVMARLMIGRAVFFYAQKYIDYNRILSNYMVINGAQPY